MMWRRGGGRSIHSGNNGGGSELVIDDSFILYITQGDLIIDDNFIKCPYLLASFDLPTSSLDQGLWMCDRQNSDNEFINQIFAAYTHPNPGTLRLPGECSDRLSVCLRASGCTYSSSWASPPFQGDTRPERDNKRQWSGPNSVINIGNNDI